MARLGMVGYGPVRHGKAPMVHQRISMERLGQARLGSAWPARRGTGSVGAREPRLINESTWRGGAG